MKPLYLILALAIGASAQPTDTTYTLWGPRTHKPLALERAVSQQANNSCMARPDVCDGSLLAMDNRRLASAADVKLAQIVSVSINHDFDGNVIINLVDVDGNRSSVWTSGKTIKDQQPMPVTGVEPY